MKAPNCRRCWDSREVKMMVSMVGRSRQVHAPCPDCTRPKAVDTSDPAEVAYWNFDARRKGYAEWAGAPMSERDAFKAEYRAALAKAESQ